MYDQYNRRINYMRISLTDRCNLHCRYCRPQVAEHLEHSDILRYEELLRVARCAVALGITRFKITGGEPLVRKGAVEFIAQLKALPGVEQVTLTTNGVLLEKYLARLVETGLDGINVSLDTLDAELYRELTGGGELGAVLSALQAVVKSGVSCKLNCVPLKGKMEVKVASSSPEEARINVAGLFPKSEALANVAGLSPNEWNILELVAFAASLGVPLRFIELMPLACNGALESFTGAELRELLRKSGYNLEAVSNSIGNGPAEYYKTTEGQLLGFIEPVYHKFCASCNRVRLTSTGVLKPCLYSPGTLDVRELLRSGARDAALMEALRRAIYAKPLGHHFEERAAGFSMNEIGG